MQCLSPHCSKLVALFEPWHTSKTNLPALKRSGSRSSFESQTLDSTPKFSPNPLVFKRVCFPLHSTKQKSFDDVAPEAASVETYQLWPPLVEGGLLEAPFEDAAAALQALPRESSEFLHSFAQCPTLPHFAQRVRSLSCSMWMRFLSLTKSCQGEPRPLPLPF